MCCTNFIIEQFEYELRRSAISWFGGFIVANMWFPVRVNCINMLIFFNKTHKFNLILLIQWCTLASRQKKFCYLVICWLNNLNLRQEDHQFCHRSAFWFGFFILLLWYFLVPLATKTWLFLFDWKHDSK